MTIAQNPFGCTAKEAIKRQSEQVLRDNYPDYVPRELREHLLALVVPPPNNMGGQEHNPPYFLPQCEKSDLKVDQKTKIDWLGFTALQELPTVHLGLEVIFEGCSFHSMPKGVRGYPKSECIAWQGQQVGIIGYGAAHGRIFVSLPGTGCSSWSSADIERVYKVLVLLNARLSRVDVALDFFGGERTWDHALFCYNRGDFNRGRHGNKKPYHKVIDQSEDGNNLGRTLYVNRRESEVMARIYEKGHEVFNNMPAAYKTLSEAREVEYVEAGAVVPYADTWLRCEIEFKRVEDDRPLPLELLLQRDNYFAGSFGYCAQALQDATPTRPKDLRTEKEVDLIKLLDSARTAYGSLVSSLLRAGFAPSQVCEVLNNGKDNRRLRASGVLFHLEKAISDWKLQNQDSDIPF